MLLKNLWLKNTKFKSSDKGKKIPVVIDLLVTQDPSKMLPGVDNRTVVLKKGDRIA